MKKFDLKKTVAKARSLDYKKLARDFVYGKPAGERRLGDLYCDKTGLYKHREWRGVKDTFYYFNKVWLYNYGMLVYDVMRYGGIWTFAKGCWRYRWMGQTYLPVLHWFDRGMEGLRGEALRACPLHYRAMTNATIYQFMQMFRNDLNTNKVDFQDVPEMVDVLQKLQDLYTAGYCNADHLSSPYASGQVAIGEKKAAMVIQGEWFVPISSPAM